MRHLADRGTRAAITVAVVVFLVYLFTYTSNDYPLRPHTLIQTKSQEESSGDKQNNGHRDPKPWPVSNIRPHMKKKKGQKKKKTRPSVPIFTTPSTTSTSSSTSSSKKLPTTPSTPPDSKFVTLNHSEASALRQINFSLYDPEDAEYLKERVEVMEERAKRVKEACLNPPPALPRLARLVWDQSHQVVWCPNYKVASTTWMINFLKLAHFNEDNEAIPSNIPEERREKLRFSPQFGAKHGQVFNLYPQPLMQDVKLRVLQDSARVIIVRHPFSRLLSAYRDKMTKFDPKPVEFKYRKIQKKIIKKYRPKNSKEDSPFPTFPEFAQYVIDSTALLKSAEDWMTNVKCWVPYWAQCHVCTMDYNVIMKLETMQEDERFLVTMSRMEELKQSQAEWRHLRNVSSTQAAPDYYRQLTTRQMLSLYKRYRFDFQLFGYTLDDYLPLAKDSPSSQPL